MKWNLAEAKNRLSEVLDRVSREGPQRIQRRNEAFVLIAEAKYEELTGKHPTLTDFLMTGPSLDGVVPMKRDAAPMRDPFL